MYVYISSKSVMFVTFFSLLWFNVALFFFYFILCPQKCISKKLAEVIRYKNIQCSLCEDSFFFCCIEIAHKKNLTACNLPFLRCCVSSSSRRIRPIINFTQFGVKIYLAIFNNSTNYTQLLSNSFVMQHNAQSYMHICLFKTRCASSSWLNFVYMYR